MSVITTAKSKYQEYQRGSSERAELSLRKKQEKEKQHAFKQMLARERAEKLEELARQRTVREKEVAVQKIALAEAERQHRLASQARGRASAALRHEKFESIKQTAKPYFKPVELGGRALRQVAQAGTTHFYTLGTQPKNSPSYRALENAFGGEPFSVEQATTVIMNAHPTDYSDAINRLKTMKSYGYIKEAR